MPNSCPLLSHHVHSLLHILCKHRNHSYMSPFHFISGLLTYTLHTNYRARNAKRKNSEPSLISLPLFRNLFGFYTWLSAHSANKSPPGPSNGSPSRGSPPPLPTSVTHTTKHSAPSQTQLPTALSAISSTMLYPKAIVSPNPRAWTPTRLFS